MDFLPLHLFPERALDASVITTVWLGVVIGALLNLRFGWLLTGLIVPGYLVPLLIHKPIVVLVIVLESILVYGLVWLVSERLPRSGLWSNTFGMDRFLSVILCAVLVRVLMDGALLPLVGEWLSRTYQISFDYRANLQSFGLTMVALVAYGLVRASLGRGLATLGVHLALTWVVVVFVLMKFTNFNLAGLSFLYEEVAANVLSSPKTYIIMIVTALLASRMNLVHGWDFNGILVPAFIAMQWNQPARILATFVEAFAVLFASQALLRLPWLQRMTVEKGRQVILFFTVSFLYKTALGYSIPYLFPEARITDFFGFGYVLCALIAMRIHTKGVGIKLTSCTLQTSLAAMLLATGIGFGLAQAQVTLPWLATSGAPLPGPGIAPPLPPPEDRTLDAHVEAQRVAMYGVRSHPLFQQPLPGDLERFREAATLLLRAGADEGPISTRARELLAELDYELRRVEDRYWLVQERSARRGWGFYVLDGAAPGSLLVEVPAPMEEQGTCAGGYRLFCMLGARSFASATNLRRPGRETALDPLLSPRTLMAVWHQVLGRASTLQVRGSAQRRTAQLRVKRELPEGLDLARLEARVGHLGTRWAPPQERNLLADLSRTRFAELMLPPRLLLRLEPEAGAEGLPVELDRRPLRLTLAEVQAAVAPAGSERFTPPGVDELLFLDEEVLTPLHLLLSRNPDFDPRSDEGRHELAPLAASARLHAYSLRVLDEPATRTLCVVLAEDPGSPRRWGTYVFRAGHATNTVVQVPRPGEEDGTLAFGHWAFQHLQARLLAVAGSSPLARRDRRSDVNRVAENGNLFALATQVLLRDSGETPGLVLQVRALSNRADVPLLRVPDADLVLWETHQGNARPLLDALTGGLNTQGFRLQWAQGQEESAGLHAETVPAARYLRASANKAFVAAWLAPGLRRDLQDLDSNLALSQQLRAAGLPLEEVDLAERLAQDRAPRAVPDAFLPDLEDYLAREGVVRLVALRRRWGGLDLRCWVDRATGRPYLVAGTGGTIGLVASFGQGSEAWTPAGPELGYDEARHRLGARMVRIRRGRP